LALPAAKALVPKSEFKMALIDEHDLLPLLDYPVACCLANSSLSFFILLMIRGLSAIFLGADFLDGADTDIS
jgi:hypothetical protein